MTEIPPPDPTARPPARRFLRSREDRVLGGVAGALGAQFGVDALLFRIGLVALTFVGGAGIAAYALAWLLVPGDDGTGRPAPRSLSWGRAGVVAGLGLLVLGSIALADAAGAGWVGGGVVVPGALLVLAAYVVLELRGATGTDRPVGIRLLAAGALVLAVGVGAVVLMLGSAWLTAAGGGAVVAVLVVALGGALVLGAFGDGVPRWLVIPALALAVPSGAVAAAGIDLDGGVGTKDYRPVGAEQLPTTYRLGVGELTIDLRDLDWSAGRRERVAVDLGAGHAQVLVPPEVCVGARTELGVGYTDVLGHDAGGVDTAPSLDRGPAASGAPRLVLEGDVGVGVLEVHHRRYDGDPDGFDPGSDRRRGRRYATERRAEERLADAACRPGTGR